MYQFDRKAFKASNTPRETKRINAAFCENKTEV